MCLYLQKRNGTYYFRRAIPGELQPAFGGKTEFMFSLRTKDKDDAKLKRSREALRTDRELEEARAALTPTTIRPAPLAPLQWPFSEADVEAADFIAREISEAEAREDEDREAVELIRARLKGSTRETPAHLRPYLRLTREAEFNNQLLRDRLAILEAKLAERGGNEAPVTPPRAVGGSDRIKPVAGAAVPLLDIFDAYAAAQGIKPGTAKEWRARIGNPIAFIGHDDAARLTEADVRRWRDHLLTEAGRGDKLRDPRTVRGGYLSAIRATLAWAKDERKLPENVAASVVVRVPKKAKLRDPDFTPEEAKRILRATLKTDSKLSPERAFAQRWIPWLCAYTGARVNEFSQLRRGDVKQIDGVWTVTITPEAGTVKANIARTIPLHPHLVEQGFPAAVMAKPEGPLFYDPAKQRVEGDHNRHFKKVGERLAEWVRKTVGITDPNIQPNHAWRHLFKSLALTSGMPERIADHIQGHAPTTVGRTYGSVPLSALVSAIETMPRFQPEQAAFDDS